MTARRYERPCRNLAPLGWLQSPCADPAPARPRCCACSLRRARERLAHAVADLRGAARPDEPRHAAGRAGTSSVARRALAARHPRRGRTVAPGADAGRSARTSSRPTPTPTTGASTTPLHGRARRRAAGRCCMTISGPGAEVGDAGQARQPHAARARRRSPPSPPPSGASTATRSTRGRSGTSPTSRSSCARSTRAAARRPRRGSTASSTSPACAGCARPARATTRSCSARPRRAATARVVAPLTLPARDAVPRRRYKQRRQVRRAERRRLRAPRLHDAPGPVLQAARQNDVTIGVLSRLTKALDRAQQRRRADRAPADLPDGVRHPVDARHAAAASRSPSRSSTARSPSGSPTTTRASWRSRSTCCATATRPGPSSTAASSPGLRFADGKPKPSLPAFRLPLAVQRTGSKASVWGLVRPARRRPTTATITYADRGSSRFKPLRTVQTDALRLLHVHDVTGARAGAGT